MLACADAADAANKADEAKSRADKGIGFMMVCLVDLSMTCGSAGAIKKDPHHLRGRFVKWKNPTVFVS